MPDYSVEQELVQFGEGSLTFLEARSGQSPKGGVDLLGQHQRV
jgi:hypothetical protein